MDRFAAIDDRSLERLVTLFYARVRNDPALGAIFNDAIEDWPVHLEKLAAFWSSVMLASGRYKGNPMLVHLRHRGRITPPLFQRWLTLWRDATNETMPAPAAAALQAKAERIAASMQFALAHHARPPRPILPSAAVVPPAIT